MAGRIELTKHVGALNGSLTPCCRSLLTAGHTELGELYFGIQAMGVCGKGRIRKGICMAAVHLGSLSYPRLRHDKNMTSSVAARELIAPRHAVLFSANHESMASCNTCVCDGYIRCRASPLRYSANLMMIALRCASWKYSTTALLAEHPDGKRTLSDDAMLEIIDVYEDARTKCLAAIDRFQTPADCGDLEAVLDDTLRRLRQRFAR